EGLRRAPGLVRASRLAHPDAAVRRAVAQGRGAGEAAVVGGRGVRERLPARPPRLTRDTPEHRWLRARIEAAAHRLALVRREEGQSPRSRRREKTLAELEEMALRLSRLLAL